MNDSSNSLKAGCQNTAWASETGEKSQHPLCTLPLSGLLHFASCAINKKIFFLTQILVIPTQFYEVILKENIPEKLKKISVLWEAGICKICHFSVVYSQWDIRM